jgi:hypothetical protein
MEQNKDILLEALRNLPDYTPENNVWEAVAFSLEKISISSKPAQLIEITPPEFIWDNIDNELNFHEKCIKLNQYDPPQKVWENIDNHLSIKKLTGVKRRVFKLMISSMAAAAIFILGFFIFTTLNSKNKNFNYTEEWMEITEVPQWEEDEIEVTKVLTLICNENPRACKSPEFKHMNDELRYLDQSKQAILNQMSKYEKNIEFEKMLMKIELQRTSLIKEMIAKTL